MWLVFRDKLNSEDREWLNSMPSIKTGSLKNLHAKCYMNESVALVTSMNLYEFSQSNNNEMGILVSRLWDDKLYKDIEKESVRLARASGIDVTSAGNELFNLARGLFRRSTAPDTLEESSSSTETLAENTREEISPSPPPSATRTRIESTQTLQAPAKGFCIRCKVDLPVNPIRPYCNSCYASWQKHKNKSFKEERCHTCGNEHTTTFLKPLCLACYGKYKDVFEFAAG